jgi:hypothetical protein
LLSDEADAFADPCEVAHPVLPIVHAATARIVIATQTQDRAGSGELLAGESLA